MHSTTGWLVPRPDFSLGSVLVALEVAAQQKQLQILRVAQNDHPEDGGPEEFAAGVATCTGLEPVIFCLKDRGLGHLVEHVIA